MAPTLILTTLSASECAALGRNLAPITSSFMTLGMPSLIWPGIPAISTCQHALHQLLKKAQIKGHVILVEQSLGGLLVRLYTEKYGKSVAGMVLVDPTHESSMLGSLKFGGWVRLREKAVGKVIPKPQLSNKVSMATDPTADYMAEEFQTIYLYGSGHLIHYDNPKIVAPAQELRLSL